MGAAVVSRPQVSGSSWQALKRDTAGDRHAKLHSSLQRNLIPNYDTALDAIHCTVLQPLTAASLAQHCEHAIKRAAAVSRAHTKNTEGHSHRAVLTQNTSKQQEK